MTLLMSKYFYEDTWMGKCYTNLGHPASRRRLRSVILLDGLRHHVNL